MKKGTPSTSLSYLSICPGLPRSIKSFLLIPLLSSGSLSNYSSLTLIYPSSYQMCIIRVEHLRVSHMCHRACHGWECSAKLPLPPAKPDLTHQHTVPSPQLSKEEGAPAWEHALSS